MAGKNLIDDFQAVSVLLAFLAIWFGVQLPDIAQNLAAVRPDEHGGADDTKYKSDIWRTLWTRIVPLFLSFLAFSIMMTPGTLTILGTFDWKPANYDFVATAWVATSFAFYASTVALGCLLLRALRRATAS